MKASELDVDEAVRVTDAGSDRDLAARLRAGDREAMGEVFDLHADRIYNFCFRRTASWAVAEDAMAATFLEVWRIRARAVAHDGVLLPWLYGVAANVCRNHVRSQRRQAALRGRLRTVEAVDDHAEEVAGRVDDERRMAALLDAAAELSHRDRQILTLVAWEGLSYQQVAVALEIPVGTVRSRLSRSRARLAQLMQTEGSE